MFCRPRIGDFVIVVCVVTICAVLIVYPMIRSSNASVAVILLDGEEIGRINLEKGEARDIDVGESVRLRILDHKIKFLDSSCRDKLCVHTGDIHKAGQAAVCIPNRVAVYIVGRSEKGGIDAIA